MKNEKFSVFREIAYPRLSKKMKMFTYFHQIRKFSNLIKENSGFFANCLYFSSNSSIFCKIFAKFRQIFIKIRPKKFNFSFREWNFIFHSPKLCADFLVNFWDWSGAKVWQSCRAWKMLQNAYLDAKIGFETEENEPPKVWRQIFSFFHSPPYLQVIWFMNWCTWNGNPYNINHPSSIQGEVNKQNILSGTGLVGCIAAWKVLLDLR